MPASRAMSTSSSQLYAITVEIPDPKNLNASTLSSISTLGASKRNQHLQLQSMMTAIESGGLDVNACDGDGRTALHLVCELSDVVGTGMWDIKGEDNTKNAVIASIMLLLELGASPILYDVFGQRAIDAAVRDWTSGIGMAMLRYRLLYENKWVQQPNAPAPFFELIMDSLDACLHFAFSVINSKIAYYMTRNRRSIVMCDTTNGALHTIHKGSHRSVTGFIISPPCESLPFSRTCDYLLLSNGELLSVDVTGVHPKVTSAQTPVRYTVIEGEMQGFSALWCYRKVIRRLPKKKALVSNRENTASAYLRDVEDMLKQEELNALRVRRKVMKSGPEMDYNAFAENVLLYPYGTSADLQSLKAKKSPLLEYTPSELPDDTEDVPVWTIVISLTYTDSLVKGGEVPKAVVIDEGEVSKWVVMQVPLHILPINATQSLEEAVKSLASAFSVAWDNAVNTQQSRMMTVSLSEIKDNSDLNDTSRPAPKPSDLRSECVGRCTELKRSACSYSLIPLYTSEEFSDPLLWCFSSHTSAHMFDCSRLRFSEVTVETPQPEPQGLLAYATRCGPHHVALCGESFYMYDLSTMQPFMGLSDGDPEGDVVSAAPHPIRKEIVLILKDSDFCIVNIAKRTCQAVCTATLSYLELERKRRDGDCPITLPKDDSQRLRYLALSGSHYIRFSPDGKHVLRHNQLYGESCVYLWSELEEMANKLFTQTPVMFNVVDYPWCPNLEERVIKNVQYIGPVQGTGKKRRVPKKELRGYLRCYSSKNAPMRVQRAALYSILAAIEDNGISPNFRDADGRTALHLLACTASTFEESPTTQKQFEDILVGLLQKGANLFLLDKSLIRPIDLLLPQEMQPVPVEQSAEALSFLAVQRSVTTDTPAVRGLLRYRQLQERANLGKSDHCVLSPTSELGDNCEQVATSATVGHVVYFASDKRKVIVMLNVQTGFSIELRKTTSVCRFSVLPYCDLIHRRRHVDYLLFNDGVLMEVTINEDTPVFKFEKTTMTFEVNTVHSVGYCCAVQWTSKAMHYLEVEADADETEPDFLVGILGLVRPSASSGGLRREVQMFFLPFTFFNPTSIHEFLCKTLTFLGDGEPTVKYELPEGAFPAHMSCAGSCNFMFVFDGHPPITYLHSGMTTIKNPLGSSVFLPCLDSQQSNIRLQESSADTSVATSTLYDGLVWNVSCSKSIDIFSTVTVTSPISTPPADYSNELWRQMFTCSIPAGDHDAESTACAVHPKHSNLLFFMKEGDLCVLDLRTEVCWVLSNVSLGTLELERKFRDGDDVNDGGLTGLHILYWSCDGEVLVRHNVYYSSFGIYLWKDIEKIIQTIKREKHGHVTYAFLPGSVDPTMRLRRPPRKEQLLGYLSRLSTKGSGVREKRSEMLQLIHGLRSGVVGPNFADADGKSALHIACELSQSLDHTQVVQTITWLLWRGASLFVVDSNGMRPADLLGNSAKFAVYTYVQKATRDEDVRVRKEHFEGKARLVCHSSPVANCLQLGFSATMGQIAYYLHPHAATKREPLHEYNQGMDTANCALSAYDLMTGTSHLLYILEKDVWAGRDTEIWMNKAGFVVLPTSKWLTGIRKVTNIRGEPVEILNTCDYILLTSGVLLHVEFPDSKFKGAATDFTGAGGGTTFLVSALDVSQRTLAPPNIASVATPASFASGAQVTSFATFAKCCPPGAGCAAAWIEQLADQEKAEEANSRKFGEREKNTFFSDDMLGSLCFFTPTFDSEKASKTANLPRALRVLRLPIISAGTELNRASYIASLLKMSSPVSKILQSEKVEEETGDQTTVGAVLEACAVSVAHCGGLYIVNQRGKQPSGVTIRGALLDISTGLSPFTMASSTVCASYTKGRRFFACFTQSAVQIYELLDVPENFFNAEEDYTSHTRCRSKLLFHTNDLASDAKECIVGNFHPVQKHFLVFLKDGELFVFNCLTLTCSAVGYFMLEDGEKSARGGEGDLLSGEGENILVGDQYLSFSCDGKYLVRHNQYFRRMSFYPWDTVQARLDRYSLPLAENNAVHLCGRSLGDINGDLVAERVPSGGGAPYSKALAAHLPKERLRGYTGRLSSRRGGCEEAKAELIVMIDNIMSGRYGPNWKDYDGRSAMHIACYIAQFVPDNVTHRNILFLLKMGANIYACDRLGRTPLDELRSEETANRPYAAVRAMLAYRAQHYPFEHPNRKTLPLEMPYFPRCSPLQELQRGCIYAQASAAKSHVCYALLVNCSIIIMDMKMLQQATLVEPEVSRMWGAAFTVLPRLPELTEITARTSTVEGDAYDLLLFPSGELVCVHLKSDFDVLNAQSFGIQYQTTKAVFAPTAALAVAGEAPAFGLRWGSLIRRPKGEALFNVGTIGYCTLDSKYCCSPLHIPDGATAALPAKAAFQLVADSINEVFTDQQNIFATVDPFLVLTDNHSSPVVQTTTLYSICTAGLSPNTRCSIFHMRAKCFVQYAPRTKGKDPVLTAVSETTEAVYIAFISQHVEVIRLTIDPNRDLNKVSPFIQKMLFIPSATEDDPPVSGCFHPVLAHLFVFIKGGNICCYDTRRDMCKLLSGMQLGKAELVKVNSTFVQSYNRIFFSLDGAYLYRQSMTTDQLLVYRWSEIEEISDGINRDSPDVCSNAIFLPTQIGIVDTLAVGDNLSTNPRWLESNVG